MGGDKVFADILCNNQLYIVWGGDTIFLISFVILHFMLGTEEHWYI